MGTNTNLKNFVLMTAIGSSVISANYGYAEQNRVISPILNIEYSDLEQGNTWHYNPINETNGYIVNADFEKYETLINFSQALIEEVEELDSEFIDIVNDNFWALI